MKIIRPGQLPDQKPFQGTCNNCKTVFECIRAEGTFVDSYRDGSFLKVNCPLCRKETFAYEVNEKKPVFSTWPDR